MITKKEKELKPCPFCGSTDITITRAGSNGGSPFVMCENCDVGTDTYYTRKEAIAAWNRRAETPAPQWSQETPTEEGWYWLMFGYECEPYVARIYSNNNEGLYLILRSGRITKLTGFIKRHPEALWCKVVSPPPLPTEGRAE